ncbi:hypothetical protein I350_04949 [Cryptococcus amylolentus CBS 6273]|uniref:Uncharacterized protein n=1 Tax=Cryptococcus amylolentus CBS 6273 TaxID=1296118 RepID=A0A1E3JYD3_9TREE|nr:hypothetical protein I350_04949 [Cryptococcus amylolentus CBS 6273]
MVPIAHRIPARRHLFASLFSFQSKSVGAKRKGPSKGGKGSPNSQRSAAEYNSLVDDADDTDTTTDVESEEGEESQLDDDDHVRDLERQEGGQSPEEEEVLDEPQGRVKKREDKRVRPVDPDPEDESDERLPAAAARHSKKQKKSSVRS